MGKWGELGDGMGCGWSYWAESSVGWIGQRHRSATTSGLRWLREMEWRGEMEWERLREPQPPSGLRRVAKSNSILLRNYKFRRTGKGKVGSEVGGEMEWRFESAPIRSLRHSKRYTILLLIYQGFECLSHRVCALGIQLKFCFSW